MRVLGRAGRMLASVLLLSAQAPALVSAAGASVEAQRDRFDTVVIDAGHGGEDEGARGPRGLREKDLVLVVAKALAIRLRGSGLRVVMTRQKDVFVPLEERTNIANDARGDLFISIHANAAHDGGARGSETYFMSLEASDEHARGVAARENQAFAARPGAAGAEADPLVAILGDLIANEHLTESSDFARGVQLRLAALDALPSRGVKQAPFVVLAGVQMPAALIEVGFITHPEEEQALRSARRREVIVTALSEAVIEHARRHDAKLGVVPAAGAPR